MKQDKIDVRRILYDLCEDEAVFSEDVDLFESGLLDSLLLIELIEELEDRGVMIPLTRIDRSLLHSVKGIEQLIEEQTTASIS